MFVPHAVGIVLIVFCLVKKGVSHAMKPLNA